nr:penicillin-binding protein [Chloroflexota bacterium]
MLLGLIAVIATTTVGVAGAVVATVDSLETDLPDVSRFETLDFAEPSVVYDRTGTIELARFESERRQVVTFAEIPRLVLDATIAVEDETFWENEGYDPRAIAAALRENIQGVSSRGASTITQQLVRARLLPPELLAPGADQRIRKAKEIIQAARLTEALPGEEGKQRIITAYLNQIFYGHGAYGVAAAAAVYFGVEDLDDLTPAQAAALAGLPQSPATLDLFKHAEEDSRGRLVVPVAGCLDPQDNDPCPAPVARRNYILDRIYRGGGRWTRLSEQQLQAALSEEIVLAPERQLIFKAPHFVWQVKAQLDRMLVDREPVERGGYRVITSIDMEAQALAERYIEAAAVVPHLPGAEFDAAITRLDLEEDSEWIAALQQADIHNAAMAAVDYRTGEVLAYVGSAGYYREDLASAELDPKYDVLGTGFRQPGSTFKPLIYATAFEERLF